MDMIRWLATNKIVLTVWGLGILAILLAANFGSDGKPEHEANVEAKAVETTTDMAKPIVAATVAVAATEKDASAEVQAVVTSTDNVSDTEVSTNEAQVTEAVVSTDSEDDQVVEAQGNDSLSDKSTDDLLMMAREAYWDNGLDEAASLYAELIAREPTVIEHKGELGNVFWRQGYPKKAAELYAGIAEPMIVKGNGERVSNMVGFIGLFFPERATDIRTLLDAQ